MAIHTAKAKPIKRAAAAGQPTFVGAARPKYVIPGTDVWEAALGRTRWLFEEFDGKVSVSNSGGKDSTVVVELALRVARERGELPLNVTWLDQECEFAATVDYQRWMADRPEIKFHWYQVPFKLFNATNHEDPWLNVWGEGEEWVRPKEPDSIHDNPFRRKDGSVVDRFKELLSEINMASGGGAILTGMRCEESPARRLFMTTAPSYKWVTWGSEGWHREGCEDYWMFHPVYDWSYRDVWKAIHDNGWHYNTHYDTQFRYGVPVKNMRVSNYHHETALSALLYLQEAEPETWDAATRRLTGINTFGQLQKDAYVRELPYMFKDWDEYLEHLISHLVENPEYQATFRKMHRNMVNALPGMDRARIAQVMAVAVCGNDLYGTTTDMFMVNNRGKMKAAAAAKRKAENTDDAFTTGRDEEVA